MFLSIWFFLALAVHLAGFATVLLWRRRPRRPVGLPPAVSVLKPLKGCDEGLEENLEGFFHQDYPAYELLFSISDPFDPARKVVEKLKRKYPEVRAQLIIGDEPALNPKVGNLIRSYRLARHDLLLVSDSNVRVRPNYLRRLASQMGPRTGVITSTVAGTGEAGLGGALEAAYLNTFYARMLSLAFLVGKPCVIGKSMMFRRSQMERIGGIEALGTYVAEDYRLGEEMRRLGLEVKLATDPIEQYIGDYSLGAFWSRHMRWGRIRKVHAPLAFLLEPFFKPALACAAGAAALGEPTVFLPLFLFFGLLDSFVAAKVSGESKPEILLAWALRELISFPMWVAVALGNSVSWRGHSLRLEAGGKIREDGEEWMPGGKAAFSGEPLQARTRLRGTIGAVIGGSGRATAILPEA